MLTRSKSIKQFTNELASKSSTPGGGSVAALQGALGCGLTAMVCNLTIGKEKYKTYEDLNINILKKISAKKDKFLQLIDNDIKAYGQMKEALLLPNNTSDEKKHRKSELQRIFKECTIPPYQMMILAGQALDDTLSIVGKSNLMAASDLGCATTNLYGCIKNAWLNVKVNIDYIHDKKFTLKIQNESLKLLKEYKQISDQIYKSYS